MTYVIQSTNPCICTAPTTPTDPECPEECNCLKLCHITVLANSDDAVGPCGKTGSIDVTDESYGHDLCACGEDSGTWTLEYFDDSMFVTASVSTDGTLSWTTLGPETLDQVYGNVILKFCCGELSAYLYVIIGVKDLCTCPECGACEDCDPCSGICLDSEFDAELTGVE